MFFFKDDLCPIGMITFQAALSMILIPIGSMGLVYLPTLTIYIYMSHGSYFGSRFPDSSFIPVYSGKHGKKHAQPHGNLRYPPQEIRP